MFYKTLLIILLAASTVLCQNNIEFATARIIDSQLSLQKPRIIVSYGSDNSEIIPLTAYPTLRDHMSKNIKEEELLAFSLMKNDSVAVINQKAINVFLKNMESKGYEIKEMESSISHGIESFIIFRKEASSSKFKNEGVLSQGGFIKKQHDLKRTVKNDNGTEVLQLLGIDNFEGKSISVKVCVNRAGYVVYAETLAEKTTYPIPYNKRKEVLKSFYGLEFSKGDKVEECGTYTVE